MTRIASSAILIALALGSQGCAATVFKPHVEAVGEYKNTEVVSEKANELEGDAPEVKVVVGQLLPGMTYKDGLFSVDPARYEVLGKVSSEPSKRFFYPYKSRGGARCAGRKFLSSTRRSSCGPPFPPRGDASSAQARRTNARTAW